MSSNASSSNEPVENMDKGSEPSDNPAPGDDISITLSVPETVEIKMVEATALADYEILFFISACFFSAFAGFFVASLQANEHTRVPWIAFTIILLLAFLIFLLWTLRKRRLLATKRSKSLRYRREGTSKKRSPASPRVPRRSTKKLAKAVEPPSDKPATKPQEHPGGDPGGAPIKTLTKQKPQGPPQRQ